MTVNGYKPNIISRMRKVCVSVSNTPGTAPVGGTIIALGLNTFNGGCGIIIVERKNL